MTTELSAAEVTERWGKNPKEMRRFHIWIASRRDVEIAYADDVMAVDYRPAGPNGDWIEFYGLAGQCVASYNGAFVVKIVPA